MKATDPIKNQDAVIVIFKDGKEKEYNFGELKSDFLSKKITKEIAKIYLPKKKQHYFVKYKATQGFKFERLSQ